MGEKQATVILQLSKQVQINGVDIGNEHSAFVEVFAAKSSNPDDFKVTNFLFVIYFDYFFTLLEGFYGSFVCPVSCHV